MMPVARLNEIQGYGHNVFGVSKQVFELVFSYFKESGILNGGEEYFFFALHTIQEDILLLEKRANIGEQVENWEGITYENLLTVNVILSHYLTTHSIDELLVLN